MINIFFKNLGLFFINKKNMYILFTVIFLLILIVVFSIFDKFLKLQNSQDKLNQLEITSLNSLEKRKKILDFIEQYSNYDKFFIDNKLENLTFLDHEKQILIKLLNHPAFCNDQQIKDRLKFIESDQNKLKFVEENIKQSTLIKETDENQLYGIEIDEIDLQKLLNIIEPFQDVETSIKLNSPQLIIKNFLLNKEKENSFFLEMKILKREFLGKQ